MYDYPDTAKFLTAEEKHEVQRRLEADRSGLADDWRMQFFWDALKDWKVRIAASVVQCIV